MRPVVLVVDVIHDFVYGKFGSKRAESILPKLKSLLNYSRSNSVPVVYVTDAHLPSVDSEFKIWGEHAIEGSKGAEVVSTVKPKKRDFRVSKRHYSCFFATGLDALLRELKIDTIVLTGLVTNICIQHTAADAFQRGYAVVIPKDCVNSISDEVQNASLSYMEEMYGAKITTSRELIVGHLLGEERI